MGTAESDWLELEVGLFEEEAGAFRAVGFAGVEGDHLEAELFGVDDFGVGALATVGVERDVVFGGDFAEGFDVLNGADFVLAVDDRYEGGLGLDGLFENFGGDEALVVWLENGDFEAFFFELFGAFVDGGMFEGADDEVVFFWVGGAFGTAKAEKGEVVGESSTRCEDDFERFAVEEFGAGAAGVFEGEVGALAGLVDGFGIGEGGLVVLEDGF